MPASVEEMILAEVRRRLATAKGFDGDTIDQLSEILEHEKPPTSSDVEKFIVNEFGKSRCDKA